MENRAEEILRLIETVDPSDAAKLDEIDARVWCYLHDVNFLSIGKTDWGSTRFQFSCKCHDEKQEELLLSSYYVTRSRDALKTIRPEGWFFFITNFDREHSWFQADGHKETWDEISTPVCKTEELAELHAIIQAIAHERGNQ